MTSVSFMLRLHKNPKTNTIAKKTFNSPHVAISTHWNKSTAPSSKLPKVEVSFFIISVSVAWGLFSKRKLLSFNNKELFECECSNRPKQWSMRERSEKTPFNPVWPSPNCIFGSTTLALLGTSLPLPQTYERDKSPSIWLLLRVGIWRHTPLVQGMSLTLDIPAATAQKPEERPLGLSSSTH